jgi:hypothetical protein
MHQIKDQVLASTGANSTGKPIPREAIEAVFRQMPQESLLHQHHDASLPPVGRIYNRRLVERDDGILAIVADIEIEDGVDITQFGGFSISYLGTTLAPSGGAAPDVMVMLDMRFFGEGDLGPVVGTGPKGERIAVRELYRFSAGDPLVLIPIAFVSYALAKGFFGAAGKDLYEFLKRKFLDLVHKQEVRGNRAAFEFEFYVEDNSQQYEVVVRADPENLRLIELGLIDLDDLRRELTDMLDPAKVQKVAATLSTKPPYLRITHVVPKSGVALELDMDQDA